MKFFAKKSLGQHFLKSPTALAKIISAANIQKGETILEIGPGTGILTDELLKSDTKLIAIEKDIRAYELLAQKYSHHISAGKLNLILGDILEIDRQQLGLEEGKYALIANIPYYITGAILELFLEYDPRPNRIVLLIQKEVADRIVARDGKESVLSVSVKAFGTPKIIGIVPPGAFSPPPTVDSAILEITDIGKDHFVADPNRNLDTSLFFKIVKTAFSHKRKYALRNLEMLFEKTHLEQAWHTLDLSLTIRAEDISVEKWLALTHFLTT